MNDHEPDQVSGFTGVNDLVGDDVAHALGHLVHVGQRFVLRVDHLVELVGGT